MPTITVTQVNTSATVLGVTNVNAYLNQINCLASVSYEIQTTVTVPQQTYITAACGSLFANIQVIASITNATATALTGYEYGFSEASCSVTARSPLANIQVIASITNATATVLDVTNVNAYLNQINCLASVSEESQTTIDIPQQTYITATCGSYCNIQVNVAITRLPRRLRLFR